MVSPAGSGSGTGGSGSLGAPQSLTQWDVETSAWAQVNKAALGIVQDSLEVAFSQLTQRYSHSHLGTQTGYQAAREQAVLEHPIESLRILTLMHPLEDNSAIAANYKELVDQLPPEVLARFLAEAEKPLAERDPSFVAIDNLFMQAATILAYVDQLSQTPAPDSLEAARTQLNLILPFVALNHVVGEGNKVLNGVDNLRNELGSNYRYTDDISDTSVRLHNILGNLQTIDWKSMLPKGGNPSNE